MGFWKIIFTGIFLSFLITLVMIIVNTFAVKLIVRFLNFTDQTLNSSLKFAFYSGLFTFLMSFLVFPFKNLILLLQVTGILLFFFVNYKLAKLVYKEATKKQIRDFFLIITSFMIIAGFFIALLITKILQMLNLPLM